MAAEKLYELHEESDFDLVVVDTPPTRNALDFLDAPGRLARFLDHRLYRVLMTPTRAYLRAVDVAAQAFLRTVSKVVGGEVLGDAIAFFQAFDGMEAGFRERAERVLHLLDAPRDGLRPGDLAPARHRSTRPTYFARRLAEGDLAVAALIVNRMHPSFGGPDHGVGAGGGVGGGRDGARATCGATWPTSGTWRPARRRSSGASPRGWRRRPSCTCRCCGRTCTTSTAWPRWPGSSSDR